MSTAKSAEKTKRIILTQPSRTLSLPIMSVVEFPESQANKLLKEYRDILTEEEYLKMKKKGK